MLRVFEDKLNLIWVSHFCAFRMGIEYLDVKWFGPSLVPNLAAARSSCPLLDLRAHCGARQLADARPRDFFSTSFFFFLFSLNLCNMLIQVNGHQCLINPILD